MRTPGREWPSQHITRAHHGQCCGRATDEQATPGEAHRLPDVIPVSQPFAGLRGGCTAMYIHCMHRTQLYLDHTIHARLKALAKRRGRTVSELVREALALVYGPTQTGERLATLRGIAGLWRDRRDLDDTDAYVRRLRRDTRRVRRLRT